MKQTFKLGLIALALMLSTSVFAQKTGFINMQELISVMPERDSAEIKLNAYSKELGETFETLQVELNTKVNEYQNALKAGTGESAASKAKLGTIQDLQRRLEEFRETAQQDIEQMELTLMTPVYNKAQEAIKKVSKAGNFVAIYHLSSLAYHDEASVINILPLVKKELGIKDETPAAPAKK